MPQTDPSTALELHVPGATGTLALAPQAWGLAQRLADTEFVPSALRKRPEAVLAAILTGNELGVGPMQALSKIHVIEGRPAMSAELMRAVVLRAGHELWIEEQSSTRVILGGKRRGSDRETKVTWTLDDAKRAKLEGRQNWQRYPAAMLLARATAALCRAIFPDVLAGISYTLEELEDGDVIDVELPAEPGSPALTPPTPEPTRARARRPATRGSSAPADTDAPVAPKVEREAPLLPGEELLPEEHEADAALRSPVDDEEPVDAELVDENGETYEGPDGRIESEGPGPTYSGPQIIAIRATEFGLDRDEKVLLCSYIVGRAVESTKELEPDEISKILDVMADETRLETVWVEAVSASATDPEPPEERRPAVGPDSWDADAWRKFLRERGVKVAEVLGEANRLAREAGTPAPTNLDGVTASGLAAALVGFVEDLAAKRAGT